MIKHSFGISPEELSLLDCYQEGYRAGLHGRAAALNPWDARTPQHDEWEKGRKAAEASFLATFAEAR